MTWPGTLQKPGIGSIIGGGAFDGGGGPGGSPLRNAINIGSTGSFTMFATFMQTADVSSGFGPICGRGSNLDAGYCICALRLFTPGQLGFDWSTANSNSAGNQDALYMSGSVTKNVPHTAVFTVLNGSAFLYLDGVLKNSATGKFFSDVNYVVAQQEDQLQVATFFHVFAGQSDVGLPGSVYQYGIGTQFWSATDVANFSANPYQFLSL